MGSTKPTPVSTYRLQITADLDLDEAARRLPYLHDLGVDWVYLSPLLEAAAGSTHGYDVVRHDRIDPSRGGEAGLAALSAEARRLGMGVLVDIVPNHVGVATPSENAWWWDLLRHGRSSQHSDAFDIDWDAGDGRLLIPVVGDGDEGSITVADGELRYHEMRFPLAPGTSAHDEQHYRLVSWRDADDKLNYRRFFAVNTLAGVRVEVPHVFADSHVEIRRWFDEGLVDGLRVDHPDGLADPEGYLDDLAELTGGGYVLVEKILALRDASSPGSPGTEILEGLSPSWATAGTTGYDALALVDRVLTDPAGQRPLDDLETRLRGAPVDWPAMVHGTKRAVADGILGSEVRRIARELGSAHADVVDAVAELLACFPVYRSYLPEGRDHLDQAFALASQHRPDLVPVLDTIRPTLTDPKAAPAKRFQQTSGMVMAKGVEDCAFYRWSRLTSLNEVGGDPSVFSVSPAEFHDAMRVRQRDWPLAMTCLSTHDTKRGEDVRARITALAELPEVWAESLEALLKAAPLPDPGFGSLLWQAILGAWPASPHPDLRDRLHGYAEKAMREAGDRTTWTEPDEEYEAAVHAAVDAAFDSPEAVTTLRRLLEWVAGPGWVNSLTAKLVAITMPGVPDVYQGSELWEQSLVDPDNRRHVDFDAREVLLTSAETPRLTVRADDPGVLKLLVTSRALRLRRDRPELFTTYSPVTATGSAAEHVLAFDRGGAITVATRLPVGLTVKGTWGDTRIELPPGPWTDVVSGCDVASGAISEVLATYPVALLAPSETAR